MLAQIDSVIFETDSNILELFEKFNFNYSKINRIQNNPTYQSVNKWDQEISFSGYFVLKKLSELEELKNIAKEKKPIWFVQKDIHFQVLIDSLSIDKSLFLKSGEFIKQGFNITLKRYFK